MLRLEQDVAGEERLILIVVGLAPDAPVAAAGSRFQLD
jgi:hypothetical protein